MRATSHCIGGEPTGDETPIYDDDRERSRCPVCGYVRLDGRCAECNGRRIEAMVAERQAAERRTAATVTTLHPAPRRLAA